MIQIRPVRTVMLAAASAAALAALIVAPAAHASTAMAGNTCYGRLSHGNAVITRTTGYIGASAVRRYWTSVTVSTTGDPYRLVVDRGYAQKRVARGATGDVTSTSSWGFGSRSGATVAVVSGVDTRTGAYFTTVC